MDNPPANPTASTEAGVDASATRYFPTLETATPSATQEQNTQPHNTSTPSQPAVSGHGHYQGWQGRNGGSMHRERDRTVLGLIFIGGGLLFLLDQVGIFGNLGNLAPLLIGAIFMYAYFTTRPGYRVGFLIPGAILLGIGTGHLISNLPFPRLWGDGSITVLTLGLGFCLIWLLERRHWWALIPGGILVMVGLSSLSVMFQLWPVALIGLGVYLLLDQSHRRPR